MKRLNRRGLKKLLLKEFKMMGMTPLGGEMIGDSPFPKMDHGGGSFGDYNEDALMPMSSHGSAAGSVSREDCCKAVLCLIECCDCEITKQKIRECCEDILASC